MAAVKPVQFMPAGIVKTMLDRKHGGPGNWFLAVNGLYVPSERVSTNLPEPDIDRVRLDPREAAVMSYPIIGGQQYFIEFDVPTYQQIYEKYVYGKEVVDYATTNTNRRIGNNAGITATAHAEWFAIKMDDTDSTAFRGVVPRLDFQGHDPDSLLLSKYDPLTESVTAAGSQFGGYDDINGEWLGRIIMEGAAGDFVDFEYDSNTPLIVAFGADRLVIDSRHIDPLLNDGDRCCIFGFQYDFLQLSGTNSFSYKWDMFQSAEVPIDMYMAMGPAIRSNIILSRHVQRATLVNIPDFGETSGDKNDHNRRTFRFEINNIEPQNVDIGPTLSDLFQESYHLISA